MTLFLVRHGRPAIDRDRPPHEWELDPAGFEDIWALREAGRLPEQARWCTSPEPKAVQTAQLLTDGDVAVVPGLVEHRRDSTTWHDDFPAVVRRAFDEPGLAAVPGWEPLTACRTRVVGTVRGLRELYPGDDLVMVGHGTSWTVLAAELTGSLPDLARWSTLAMPDVIVVEPA